MGTKKAKQPRFIEDKPSFKLLVKIYNELKLAHRMLNALADENDTVQRATDLYNQIESIHKLVRSSLLVDQE